MLGLNKIQEKVKLGNIASRKYNIVLMGIWPEPYKTCKIWENVKKQECKIRVLLYFPKAFRWYSAHYWPTNIMGSVIIIANGSLGISHMTAVCIFPNAIIIIWVAFSTFVCCYCSQPQRGLNISVKAVHVYGICLFRVLAFSLEINENKYNMNRCWLTINTVQKVMQQRYAMILFFGCN